MNNEYELHVEDIIQTVRTAGQLVMEFYHKKYQVNFKKDNSPVTEADIVANDYIVENLKKISANIPIITEENDDKEEVLSSSHSKFWLVDPIDGTNGFINKDDQFTVNVALVSNSRPILGFIYVPVTEELYYTPGIGIAYKINKAGQENILKVRDFTDQIDVLTSISKDRGINFLRERYKINSVTPIGSSLKLCYIADGLADAYAREGLTMEWDTAAGQAILEAAGGKIVDYNQNALKYGKEKFKNSSFIAFGSKSIL